MLFEEIIIFNCTEKICHFIILIFILRFHVDHSINKMVW